MEQEVFDLKKQQLTEQTRQFDIREQRLQATETRRAEGAKSLSALRDARTQATKERLAKVPPQTVSQIKAEMLKVDNALRNEPLGIPGLEGRSRNELLSDLNRVKTALNGAMRGDLGVMESLNPGSVPEIARIQQERQRLERAYNIRLEQFNNALVLEPELKGVANTIREAEELGLGPPPPPPTAPPTTTPVKINTDIDKILSTMVMTGDVSKQQIQTAVPQLAELLIALRASGAPREEQGQIFNGIVTTSKELAQKVLAEINRRNAEQ
jgi:hypothetical protein